MAHTTIPRQQLALLGVSNNAAALLLAEPFRYGITPQQAREFQTYADDYAAKLAAAVAPDTSTRATVAVKEESRLRLLYVMRPLLQDIKMNAGVATDDKVSLGLLAGGVVRTRIAAPTTEPVLNAVVGMTRQHVLRYHDITAPTRKAKPDGVAALELWCLVGDATGPDRENARHIGLVTRQYYVVSFAGADVGKIAHYWARWVTRRGLMGPWSQRCSLMVAG